MEVQTRTRKILKAMRIVSWIAFIGFMIQAGAILISFLITLGNPEGADNIYDGMNLAGLMEYSILHYTIFISFLVLAGALKAYVWFLVIKILSQINLLNPFSMTVIRRLEQVSLALLGTWIMIILGNMHANYVQYETGVFYGERATGEYLFIAGLVFVISQVFKRGLEIQAENELTV